MKDSTPRNTPEDSRKPVLSEIHEEGEMQPVASSGISGAMPILRSALEYGNGSKEGTNGKK